MGSAHAICAMPPPKPCGAFFNADTVLLGTILSEDAVSEGQEYLSYTVRVDRPLRGRLAETVALYTGNDSGRATPTVGTQAVLFAYTQDGRLNIGCNEDSLSDPKNTAKVLSDIERLMRLPATTPASIEGQVLGQDFQSGVAGVRIRVVGNKSEFHANTDTAGNFSLMVPAGTYHVVVDPAVATQTIYSLMWMDATALNLQPGECAQLQYSTSRR